MLSSPRAVALTLNEAASSWRHGAVAPEGFSGLEMKGLLQPPLRNTKERRILRK